MKKRDVTQTPDGSREAPPVVHGLFTLIELLVVVAIIAILAALLLSTLRHARDRSRTAACTSTGRQWGVGFNLYADDFDGFLPYEGSFGDISVGKNTQAWHNTVSPYLGQPPLKDLFAAGNPPVAGKSSIFACPAARPPAAPPTVTNPKFMYGLNNFMDPNDSGPVWNHYRFSVAEDPSRTALFADNNQSNDPGVYGPDIPSRHQNGACFAFVDGRAGWLPDAQYFRPTSYTSTDEWNGAWGRYIYFYPYSGATN